MKQRLRIALAFAVACTMLFTASAGYGEGGSIPLYEVLPQKLNDPGYIMERGMGGVKLEMTPSEDGAVLASGYIGGYQLTLDSQTGWFDCDQPDTYPHIVGYEWISPAQEAQLTSEPGLYTPEEAAEIGLQFLHDVIGMDTSRLYVLEIVAGEADKERSCVHRIEYAYRVDDMRVGWWWADKVSNFPMTLSILVWVTDSGVDDAHGRAVSFAPCAEVARADILAQDAIADLAQSSTPPELMYLPIEQDEKEVLRPFWAVLVDMGAPHEYDALTGEELLNDWDALPLP